jgi:hypothetical protein
MRVVYRNADDQTAYSFDQCQGLTSSGETAHTLIIHVYQITIIGRQRCRSRHARSPDEARAADRRRHLICGEVPDDQPDHQIFATLSVPHRFNQRTQYRKGQVPVSLHLQSDWQRVLGQYVEIRRHGKTIRTGKVEAVMPDNSILWIAADGGYSRELVERADGSLVYARFAWDHPPRFGPG